MTAATYIPGLLALFLPPSTAREVPPHPMNPTSNLQPPGDAHVIRNAGGRASDDALRSLTISQRLLGTTEIHVIHHTDCGMLTFTNDQVLLRAYLAR